MLPAGHQLGPLLAGRLAALAALRRLRKSSVGESPDVVPSISISTGDVGTGRQRWRQQQQQQQPKMFGSNASSTRDSVQGRPSRWAGGVLQQSTAAAATALPPAAARQQFQSSQAQQQQQQQQVMRGSSEFSRSTASTTTAQQQQQQQWEQPEVPVVSPIEGLGALRRSWGNLPTSAAAAAAAAGRGPHVLRTSSSSLRLSLTDSLLLSTAGGEQAMQQQLGRQGATGRGQERTDGLTLEEQASVVLRRLMQQSGISSSGGSIMGALGGGL